MKFKFKSAEFGKDIKIKRTIENDLDLRTQAEKLNISPTTLHKLEHGTCLPSLHTYWKICTFLKKDFNTYL